MLNVNQKFFRLQIKVTFQPVEGQSKMDEPTIEIVITISVESGIDSVRSGRREALGELLESYRPYLSEIARREMADGMNSKIGGSDLVQETFLKAQCDFDLFHGQSARQLKAWLRQILLNSMAHIGRQYRVTKKRDMSREISLYEGGARDSLASRLPAEELTPRTTAIRKEQISAIQDVLAQLPERERQTLVWRNEEDCTFDEIGRRLSVSATAAHKTWLRAIDRLRRKLSCMVD